MVREGGALNTRPCLDHKTQKREWQLVDVPNLFHPAKQRVDETWNFLSEQVIRLLYRMYTRPYKTADQRMRPRS